MSRGPQRAGESAAAELLKAAIDRAAAWRGLARQYYDRHQAGGPHDFTCQCAICVAYRQRERGEQQQERP